MSYFKTIAIDQTTPGDTNGVQVNAALPAGTNVIGHVIVDSGAVTATVSGVATAAKQDTGNTSVASIDTKTPALGQALAAASVPVVLTAAQVTTLTPPAAITGYATETTLAGALTISDFDAKTGALTETAPATDTASSGLNGRLQRIAQRLSSIIALLPTALGAGGGLKVDGSGTALPISGTVTATVTSTTVTGNVATTVADGANVTLGAKADAKSTATDTTPITAMSVWKQISASVQAAVTALGSPFQAGGSIGNTSFAATQASAASLNATVVGSGAAGTAAGGVLTVQGVAAMTKLLVTPDSVALPANQSVNVAQMNGVTTTMGAGNSGTGVQRVVIATDQPALTNKLLVTPDANSAINLAQVNGTTTVNGGSAAGILAVGGPNATNVAITGNPVNNGAQAVSSENAAVTTTRMVQLVADLVGKLIVLPYSNPENFVSGAITSAMTGTTSTSLLAAPASGLRNYITTIVCSNAHGTVGTDIVIQDGSGGTALMTIPAAAIYGGAVISLPVPLRQPTTATAIFCANVTTGASTKVSAVGYKGA